MDTIWFAPQPGKKVSVNFEELTEKPAYLKKHFKDTSSYAIVYLYRPQKVWAMINEYYVYCNDEIIYWAINKTSTAYKVYIKGPAKFYAKSGNVESSVTVDLKPGKRYYVQCIIHHKLSKVTPELRLMPEDAGKEDYEQIAQ